MARTNNAARTGSRRKAKKQHGKSPPKAILCTVCGKGDGKYKCPKCRAPFCCVQCSKDHRANLCTAARTTDAAASASTEGGVVVANNEQSNYLSGKELNINQPERKRVRRTNSDDDDSHDDEPGWNITPEMKERVRQSAWLREELKDGGLRQLIGQIDAASDEEEDAVSNTMKTYSNNKSGVKISPRELALARMRHSRPKFASFIDRMLLTAGVLQPADGGGEGGDIMSLLEGRGPAPLVLAPAPRVGATEAISPTASDSGSGDDSSESDGSSEDSSDSCETSNSDESDAPDDSEGS
mmetsp:Transcript_11745/g.25398  ORF Transcript_11745/g.25398 Transcript_11745/m.25398 type:complete len:297 (+) Transcript_11745:77-967(+)